MKCRKILRLAFCTFVSMRLKVIILLCFLGKSFCANVSVRHTGQSRALPKILEFAQYNHLTDIASPSSIPIQASKAYSKGSISEICFLEFKTLKEFINALATKKKLCFFFNAHGC